MLLLGERPTYVDQLTDRIRKLTHKLFEDIPPGETVTLHGTNDLYALESPEKLFIVRTGNITGHLDNRLCLHYERGDLIGLSQSYQLPSLRISIDDQAEVDQYDADTLLRYALETKERQSIWTSYLISVMTLFQDAYARSTENITAPHTGFMHFAAGQTIIAQGDDAHEVFTILGGEADVFVDGVCVGDVQQDEIFGAMAVFTNEKRSATVVAKTDCTVLAVPKEDFITLIKSHPQTTMTLIDNLARRIKLLNSQISGQG